MCQGDYNYFGDTTKAVGMEVIRLEDNVLFKVANGYAKTDKERLKKEIMERKAIDKLISELEMIDKAEALFHVSELYKNKTQEV